MTSRSSFVFALALSLATPALLSQAQTPAPADSSAAAAAPAATPAPAPAPTPAPAMTPTPAPAPAEASTSADRPTTYTMEAGDTLDSIAKKFDTSIHALTKLNHIEKSQYKKLRAGKVLKIPPAKVETSAAK